MHFEQCQVNIAYGLYVYIKKMQCTPECAHIEHPGFFQRVYRQLNGVVFIVSIKFGIRLR